MLSFNVFLDIVFDISNHYLGRTAKIFDILCVENGKKVLFVRAEPSIYIWGNVPLKITSVFKASSLK